MKKELITPDTIEKAALLLEEYAQSMFQVFALQAFTKQLTNLPQGTNDKGDNLDDVTVVFSYYTGKESTVRDEVSSAVMMPNGIYSVQPVFTSVEETQEVRVDIDAGGYLRMTKDIEQVFKDKAVIIKIDLEKNYLTSVPTVAKLFQDYKQIVKDMEEIDNSENYPVYE